VLITDDLAGNSMLASIVVGLVSDKTIPDAMRYGVTARTSTLMSPGSELCNLDDTERLFPQVAL
jgi:6-phosphofructokinase 2